MGAFLGTYRPPSLRFQVRALLARLVRRVVCAARAVSRPSALAVRGRHNGPQPVQDGPVSRGPSRVDGSGGE
jgi:hypothetical protein